MKTDTKQIIEIIEIIEIIGIFGVIASLIFIGMQVVLERRVAAAGQYENRAEMRVQQISGYFGNPDYINDMAETATENI